MFNKRHIEITQFEKPVSLFRVHTDSIVLVNCQTNKKGRVLNVKYLNIVPISMMSLLHSNIERKGPVILFGIFTPRFTILE